MLDFNHNPQIFPDAFAAIPVPDVLVPQVEYRAYWDNQTVEVRLQATYDTQLDWRKYKLGWELNKASGEEGIGVLKGNAAIATVGVARIPMPRVQTAQLIPLTLRVIDIAGDAFAQRSDNLLVLPSRAAQARFDGEVAVMTTGGSEAVVVGQLNYSVVEALSPKTQVVVTDAPDIEMLNWVQDGGKMLFVNEDNHPVFWQYEHRDTSEGNWITSTSWLRPEVYPSLKIDNPLNLPLQRVMPQGNIVGLPQKDPSVQRDFLAGRISGWVQRPSIHTVQFAYGSGTVIMTTYALLESLYFGGPDPVGVIMLNDLIDYLVSDVCKPVLRVKV
ncbi:MAG: hypothetical protein H0X30_03335 [Anaerolineae bacterium]|nr:hypothetical protein [Anaerolineae bacterium]